jgi:hypothetical protein
MPTVPPPAMELPAPAVVSASFEPVQLPPIESAPEPALELEPAPALEAALELEPTPMEAALAPAPVAHEPALIAAEPARASSAVARVVAPAVIEAPKTFGELLDRALALRPR